MGKELGDGLILCECVLERDEGICKVREGWVGYVRIKVRRLIRW